MLEAMRAMQQRCGHPSWAMLMGDFNSIPGSAIYRCACAAVMEIVTCREDAERIKS